MCHEYKIVLIGNSGVGKTSLVRLYESGRPQETTLPSVGLEFVLKQVNLNKKDYLLKIWDTSGQEKFKSLAKTFYKNCKGFLVIFSVDDLNSFVEVERWISEIADNSSRPCWILIGNKIDVRFRQVTSAQAFQLAKKYEVPYYETTIFEDKRPENSQTIAEVFKQLVTMLDKNEGRPLKMERNFKLSVALVPQPKGGCCR